MSSYDPKLLESWFRFMAEATKSQAQASDMMDAMSQATSPQGWAEVMGRFAPKEASAQKPEALAEWSAAYWEAFGFVPQAKYEELRDQYLELKGRLETAEREARHAKQLLAIKGQEEQAKEAVDAWSDTVNATLQAQSQWWSSWFDSAEQKSSEEENKPDET